MNIFEKINNGEYENKEPYVSRPRMPSILRKNVSNLTDSEIESLIEVKKQYQKDLDDWNTLSKSRSENERRLLDKFENDLAEEYGMSDHPKRTRLFGKAWELGHSSGLSEVANYYDDLYDLVK